MMSRNWTPRNVSKLPVEHWYLARNHLNCHGVIGTWYAPVRFAMGQSGAAYSLGDPKLCRAEMLAIAHSAHVDAMQIWSARGDARRDAPLSIIDHPCLRQAANDLHRGRRSLKRLMEDVEGLQRAAGEI